VPGITESELLARTAQWLPTRVFTDRAALAELIESGRYLPRPLTNMTSRVLAYEVDDRLLLVYIDHVGGVARVHEAQRDRGQQPRVAFADARCLYDSVVRKMRMPKRIHKRGLTGAVGQQVRALYSASATLRAEAAYRLGQMGQEAVPCIPYLMGLLGDDAPCYPDVIPDIEAGTFPGIEAAKALGRIGEPAIQPLVGALVRSQCPVAREHTALALARIGAPAVDPLIPVLKDGRMGLRRAAASVLGEIGDERAVEALVGALTDSSSLVGTAAAEALGKIGDRRAVEPLTEAAGNRGVRAHAEWALESIPGKP
jgi:hypothetical protein